MGGPLAGDCFFQIVYEHTARRGVAPVRYTVPEADLDRLEQRLHLSRHIHADRDLPTEGNLYFRRFGSDDRWALLIFRQSEAAQRFTSRAHVLIGPSTVLTPDAALTMWQWPWSMGSAATGPGGEQPLPEVTFDAFRRTASAVTASWQPALTPATHRLLVELVCHQQPLAVKAHPRMRRDLLAAVAQQAPALLDGFSVHETRYDESQRDLPRLCFVTEEQPPSGFEIRRRLIDLDRAESDPDLSASVSGVLVNAFTSGGRTAVLAALDTRLGPDARTIRHLLQKWDVPMTNGPSTPPAGTDDSLVRCPTCLDEFVWDRRTVVVDRNGPGEATVDLDEIGNPLKRAEALVDGEVKCTNPSGDFPEAHYLPVDYVRLGKPLVIGFVGTADTGKSTLLAAMVHELTRDGLAQHRLDVEILDRAKHRAFKRSHIDPLFEDSVALDATKATEAGVEFVAAFRIGRGDEWRPVVFFDVGGESLKEPKGKDARFLLAVEALIFVVDPRHIERNRINAGRPEADETYAGVLDRITPIRREQGLEAITAAVVVAKADELRFDPVVGKWLGRGGSGPLDPDLAREESRDVYSYLFQQGAEPWLGPVDRSARCTLHFLSATGSKAGDTDRRYPRGLRPRRVLEPLAAILAMAGVITTPGAERIGR
ncbi:hypothetical protein [Catenulispora sp. EB89]|uniref:TRAFAC clade GTPase domain-containing protein n=1 Tax=Catenulispora sp. EB89 TaxID=3156257 RepID=UPI00351173EB